MISQISESILQPTALSSVLAGTGATINTGQIVSPGVIYTGNASGIDNGIGAVTDISDPAGTGGWTDLLDISGGPLQFQFFTSTVVALPKVVVNTAEDPGAALRMQMLIDGVVVWDSQVIADGVGIHSAQMRLFVYESSLEFAPAIYCASSLLIRAAREGAFTNADSSVWTEDVQYQYVKKV